MLKPTKKLQYITLLKDILPIQTKKHDKLMVKH